MFEIEENVGEWASSFLKLFQFSKTSKKAFTLAEVLITLLILGVVFALTISSLHKKSEERIIVSKVQNFYTILSKAYGMAVARNGGAKYWGTKPIKEESANRVYTIIVEPYFKVQKNCGTKNEGECLINLNYKNFFDEEHYNYGALASSYKVLLEDGSLVWFRGGDVNLPSEYLGVYYDVNGKKGPNKVGVDLFYFRGFNDRILPYGFDSYKTTCHTTGFACTSWIIYEKNMKYLK